MSRTIISIRQAGDTKAVILFDPDEKLVLPIDIIYKFALRRNDEIDDAVFEELVHAGLQLQIYDSALRYLGMRMHTTRELEQKLQKKKFNHEIIKEALHRLKEQKLLDDEAFARLYIVHAFFDKKHGANKIVTALQKRGVDYRVTKRLIEEVTTPEDRTAPLLTLARKKLSLLQKRKYDERQIKQKLIAFLLGRGFEYDAIKTAMREINPSSNSDESWNADDTDSH